MMLNAEQEKAAHYSGKKTLLVKAGPGSGKTRVIIERVKFLYSKLKVNPASIVVITFSRKAADELIERLAKENIPPEDIALMNISTIHSFCFSLLSFDHSLLEIISDDNEERLNLFIRKHLDELGFKGTATLQSKREIDTVIKKFSEFTAFKVDVEGLVTYIEENNPVSDEFKALVEESEEFPREEAKKNYKDDWYNARYLQIAKAYPIFIELLEDAGYIDFDSIQRRALQYLKNNPETHYKHILVDEFQDTDAVQLKIFQEMREHCETFTAVGDVDQRIYGFRGATENCFEKMKDNDCESINLDINYRSSNEVIDLSEDYISYQRAGDSAKVTGDRQISKPSFYMESKDSYEEGERIAEMISYLKESKKVKNYGDIAILTRSVSSHAPKITENLQEKNIPYHVTGLNDFIDSDEIKSVIATLYAIIPPSDSPHIMSGWEKEWLNLKAFSGEKFKYLIHDFSTESREILIKIQNNFEEDALSCEKEVYKKLTGKTSRKKKFKGIFDRDEEVLIEVFENVQKPDLLQVKLNNKEDQEFIEFLKYYREMFFDEHSLKSLSILDLFYDILRRGGFLEHDYLIDPKNRNIVKDLAQLSQTIYNYEEMMSMRNLRGLYWFLTSKLNSYSKNIDPDEDLVPIMTIHKSKGLEFPIVIIPSLTKGKFPTPYQNPLDNRHIAGKSTFYTPDEYLEFKEERTPEQKEKIHDEEEDRIIYVAMTRAKDTMIMSSVKKIPKKIRALISNENINPLANYKQLEKVESEKKEEGDKTHKMDYTRLRDYQDCPFKYYFLHELNFKVEETKDMKKGIMIHKIFQHINREILKHDDITDEKIDEIIEKVLNKDHNKLKEETYDNIYSFYDNFGKDIEVIDTEFPFTMNLDQINFRGIIDLIFEKDGKLGILDYKNTTYKENRMESYKQQLHLYMHGLSLNPKFKDRTVEKLQVYFTKSGDLVDVEIDEELKDNLINKIKYISKDIDLGKFERTTDEEKCENCNVEKNCRNCENY